MCYMFLQNITNSKLSGYNINCNNKGLLYNIQYLQSHGGPLSYSPHILHLSLISLIETKFNII